MLKAGDAVWGLSPGYDLIPEIDLPLNHSYFFDGTHSCPPLSPLSLQLFLVESMCPWTEVCKYLFQFAHVLWLAGKGEGRWNLLEFSDRDGRAKDKGKGG